jgi:hypothetical protein
MNSVAWISARKHVLALLFILIATDWVVQAAQRKKLTCLVVLGILVSYGISCFSHPISVLWPVFALTYLWGHGVAVLRSHTSKTFCALLITVCLVCIVLNQTYYTELYVAQTGGVGKYVSAEHDTLGIKLLVLGRYFFQMICPIWACITPPYAGSPKNLVGLVLLPVCGQMFRKYAPRESAYWLLYSILPLAPVVLKMTNNFASDTYLLNALIGFFVAMACLIHAQRVEIKKWIPLATTALLAICFGKSFQLARVWESTFKIFEYSYFNEPTPANTAQYGLHLLDTHHHAAALELARQVAQWKPEQRELPLLYAKTVYSYPTWSTEKKIQELENHRILSPWFSYFLAGLQAKNRQFEKAHQEMQLPLKNLNQFVYQFDEMLELVTAETFFFCAQAKQASCHSLISDIQQELLTHPELRKTAWNESMFSIRMNELKAQFGQGK